MGFFLVDVILVYKGTGAGFDTNSDQKLVSFHNI